MHLFILPIFPSLTVLYNEFTQFFMHFFGHFRQIFPNFFLDGPLHTSFSHFFPLVFSLLLLPVNEKDDLEKFQV